MLTCNHKDCRRGLYESRIKQISPVRQKRFISGITSVVLGESLKSLRIRNGRVSKALKALPAESGRSGGEKSLPDLNLGSEVMVNSVLVHCKEISS